MSPHSKLELPQSVFQYLTEPKLRAGVESVLDFGTKKLPPGLEWDELPRYFRAALAATSVQIDLALALEELWRRVWPSEVVGWSHVSVDEQSTRDFDAHVSIDKCWSEEWFGRCFTRRAPTSGSAKSRRQASSNILCLGVSINLQGASVGVSIDPPPNGAGPDATLFHYDEEVASWWSVEQSVTGTSIELRALQHAAGQALNWLAEGSRGKK